MAVRRACAARTVAVFAAAALLLTGCGSATQQQTGQTRTFTDLTGRQVRIPATLNRIADSWPAHTPMLQMLGAGDKLVATVPFVTRVALMRKLNPRITSIPTPFNDSAGNSINIEALAAQHPDVYFQASPTAADKRLASLGIPVANMIFKTFPALIKSVTLTGQMLGPDAQARAARYVGYLQQQEQRIGARVNPLPAQQRPSVVHLSAATPRLMVDGHNTLIDEWIRIAGGRNGADIEGNGKSIDFERLLAWNPDVIIVGQTSLAELDQLRGDPKWRQLKAVQGGRFYANPQGIFPWDRYGPEAALQIQWAAKTLHPELFGDLDMTAATRDFFQNFLNYRLTDQDIDAVLHPRGKSK